MHDLDVTAREALGILQGSAVGDGEAVENAPHGLDRTVRWSLPQLSAGDADPLGHVPRCQERGVVGIDHRLERRYPGRPTQEILQIDIETVGLPLAQALL
jgi:hypothetical protein